MVELTEISSYLDRLLKPKQFKDYCPNGLQVAGKPVIKTLVTGVTANLALIDAAIAHGADAILVHHGYFWRGEDPCVTGIKRTRLKRLLDHDISMFAYHLPLDVHAQFGNNVQLARQLNFTVEGPLDADDPNSVGLIGRLPVAMSAKALAAHLSEQLERQPLHIGDALGSIETIAWCTGAAQGYMSQAVDRGVDAYVSGEISEPTVHLARESGVHYFAAGHHATERYGVNALGDHLAEQFGIAVEFIDIPNPV